MQINQSSEEDINRQIFTLLDEKKRSLHLNMEYIQYGSTLLFRELILFLRSFGCIKVVIYCKYWIVNRTGLPTLYKPKTRNISLEYLAAGQKGKHLLNIPIFNLMADIIIRPLRIEGDPRNWYPSAETGPNGRTFNKIGKPLLFSFEDDDVRAKSRKVIIKIANSEWSKVKTWSVLVGSKLF